MQNKNNNQRGFTIIETMIAVSLFVVVVMSGMAALLNANLIQQKSQSMRSIIDNMSFILEDISRNLRTGTDVECFQKVTETAITISGNAHSCSDGWAIAFESADGHHNNTDQWVYYISDDGKIFKSVEKAAAGSFIQLTPEEVVIDIASSGFSVLGAEQLSSGDEQQPFSTIRLVGNITFKDVVTPFSLQTSVSQRGIDR